MPGGDLRYWSVCQNDPITQRFVACTNDDRAVLGDAGFATYVISTPNERPPNATRECGVNWLPWGPNQRGAVIYRHMLPAAGYTRSIQAASADKEARTMGDVFPASRYYADKAAFAKLGCTKAGSAAALAPPSRTARRRCASRRRFTVRVPRGTRTVRLGSRRLRVRRGRAVVDLRGRPRQTVRLRIRLRSGRNLTRTYRTCRRR
jgi:hypothetical protein